MQNTATLSNFNVGSDGSAGDDATIFAAADATGSLATGVTLDANGAFSFFQQDVAPGATITFTLNTTADLVDPTAGDTPDELIVQLLDGAGNAVPTLDPDRNDSFVAIAYDAPLDVETFGSDPNGTTTGGATLRFAAPTASLVPEPAAATAVAAAALTTLNRRRRASR